MYRYMNYSKLVILGSPYCISKSLFLYPPKLYYEHICIFPTLCLLFRFCLVGEPESKESPVIKVLVNLLLFFKE